MIIKQNIPATLLTFSNLQKNLYEKLYTKETTSKTTTTEFISKIPNRKITNFQVMMAYQQNVMNIFQINQLLIFLDVYDSCRILGTTGVLEQESCLPYIKKEIKKYITNYRPISLLNLNYQIYPTILKNRMKKISVTIKTEKKCY